MKANLNSRYSFFARSSLRTIAYLQVMILCVISPLVVTSITIAQQNKQSAGSYIQQLKTADEEQRSGLIESLAGLGSSAVPDLMNALQDKDPAIRKSAAIALGKIGKDANAAVPALKKVLDDKDFQVRSSAMQALSSIDRKVIVPFLISELSTGEAWERYSATHALRTFGKEAVAAVPALIKTIKEDEDSWVRTSAASALGTIGKDAHTAIPILIKSLEDGNETVRYGAAYALGNIGESFYEHINQLSPQEISGATSSLEKALQIMKNSQGKFRPEAIASVNDPLLLLKKAQQSRSQKQ
ncbi:HEAT repeat domain-containing protein [Mastigocoleus testarum]|uniref:PBS lyase n=1 Tax=Mastigocoleus testarum BC008 TaxID=371196 RepID=A0A0V7ZH26_9CYAN|nr:HEAT repeat domain-containing protein [Mastigocoleus testarum]KST63824.1 hypothetical protein BC008_15320 [Mastigocoleus testarum BC008]